MYVLGTSFEEILRKGVEREQYGPIDGQDIEDWIQERLAYHRDPKGAVEYDLPDGRCIRVEEKKTPEGGIVGVRTDITDLKKIERQLLKSEERFKAFFENSPAAIYLKDQKNALYWSTNSLQTFTAWILKKLLERHHLTDISQITPSS